MPASVLAVFLATAALTAPSAAPAAAQPTAEPTTATARSIVASINAVRARRSLRPLRLARPLTSAAAHHSQDMGEQGYFSHTSADGTSFWKRVGRYYRSRGFRYWSVGENLLWSSPTVTPSGAVNMWMDSPPHRKNLLNRHWRDVGLSVRQFSSAPGVFQGLTVTIVTADFGVRY